MPIKIIPLIFLLFYLNACVSLPKEKVDINSKPQETICAKLKIKELFQGRNSNRPTESYTFKDATMVRHEIVMKKFNRYGIYDKNCENPSGEYEVNLISFGTHSYWQRNWRQASLFSLGLVPYWEQNHVTVVVRKGEKIILEKDYEYEVWGSVFLILALPYFQVKYGAMEVVPWLQIKEASDAIRKDVSAILSTSLIINGNNNINLL